MQLVQRLVEALGVDPSTLPRELFRPAPFEQTALELDAVVRWLARERPLRTLPTRFDPLLARVREESLRAAPDVDEARVQIQAPLEATLHLGALTRMAALVAARAPEADDALIEIAPLIAEARPIARTAVLRLAEIGTTEGALGRRARALLEDALHAAIAHAHELGEEHAAATTGRMIDLVGALGALAAHREGLTQRLSELAPQAPPFAGPFFVVAYLAALGAADRGPYLDEIQARLRRAANDGEPSIRALALEACSGHPALADEIESALHDPSAQVRTACALAIAELGTASDAAAKELVDMVELGDPEESIAAARALRKIGRSVPAEVVDELDDPLVQATIRALAEPDDERFTALAHAYGESDPDDYEAVDPRVRPLSILVETLQSMSPVRAARHVARFAAGEPDTDPIGEALYHALEACETVPDELLAAGAPLFDVLGDHEEHERVPLAALIASRLYPGDPRVEPLVLARLEPPVSLIALSELDAITATGVRAALDVLEQPDGEDDLAALAISALARCGAAEAPAIASLLVDRIDDGDPTSEPAHAALLEMVARGVVD